MYAYTACAKSPLPARQDSRGNCQKAASRHQGGGGATRHRGTRAGHGPPRVNHFAISALAPRGRGAAVHAVVAHGGRKDRSAPLSLFGPCPDVDAGSVSPAHTLPALTRLSVDVVPHQAPLCACFAWSGVVILESDVIESSYTKKKHFTRTIVFFPGSSLLQAWGSPKA